MNADHVGQIIYDALGDELRLHDWKPWPKLSFEIKDRYRRIAQKVIDDAATQNVPATGAGTEQKGTDNG